MFLKIGQCKKVNIWNDNNKENEYIFIDGVDRKLLLTNTIHTNAINRAEKNPEDIINTSFLNKLYNYLFNKNGSKTSIIKVENTDKKTNANLKYYYAKVYSVVYEYSYSDKSSEKEVLNCDKKIVYKDLLFTEYELKLSELLYEKYHNLSVKKYIDEIGV